jgi:hypothetical protein
VLSIGPVTGNGDSCQIIVRVAQNNQTAKVDLMILLCLLFEVHLDIWNSHLLILYRQISSMYRNVELKATARGLF